MPSSPFDAGRELTLPFAFFRTKGNTKAVVPLAISSGFIALILFACGVVGFALNLFQPNATFAQVVPWVVIGLAFLAIAAIAQVYATLIALCTAGAALAHQPIDLARDVRHANRRAGAYFTLICVFFAIALVLVALCFVLVGFPLLLLFAFSVFYAPAAVVIGGESPMQAMATSLRIAKEHKFDTLIGLSSAMGANSCWSFASNLISWLPLVNVAVSGVVGGYAFTYGEFVRARFFLVLREPGVVTTFSVKTYSPA